MPDIGIIAGSGFGEIDEAAERGSERISTPYGDPSDSYRICEISGVEAAFLARHGRPHHTPPHKINYRANLWGFKKLGTKRIFSVSAAGGISSGVNPGDIVIPDQIIDMTSGRRTKAVIFTDSGHIILAALAPETIASRLQSGRSGAPPKQGLDEDTDEP